MCIPEITVIGKEKTFGKLRFDFKKDGFVEWNVYLKPNLKIATKARDNFAQIMKELQF